MNIGKFSKTAIVLLLIIGVGSFLGVYIESPSLEWADVCLTSDSTYTIKQNFDKTASTSNLVLATTVDVYGTASNDTININLIAYYNDPAVALEGLEVVAHEYAGTLVDTIIIDTVDAIYYNVFDACSLYVDLSSDGTPGLDSVDVVVNKEEY